MKPVTLKLQPLSSYRVFTKASHLSSPHPPESRGRLLSPSLCSGLSWLPPLPAWPEVVLPLSASRGGSPSLPARPTPSLLNDFPISSVQLLFSVYYLLFSITPILHFISLFPILCLCFHLIFLFLLKIMASELPRLSRQQ